MDRPRWFQQLAWRGGIRLANYLVDFDQRKTHEGHKGKGFVLEARHRSGNHGVFVSWVEYGASPGDIHILEATRHLATTIGWIGG